MGKTVFKVTEEMKQQIIALYNQGLMDSEIARQIGGITDSAVFYWRKKLGLKTKFDYSKVAKIDREKFESLFKQGLSDYAIAKKLGMSPDGVYSHRLRHGYIRKSLMWAESVPLTQFQKEVLMGTLLGDSSLRIQKEGYSPIFSCSHGVAQKEYCEYKTEIFKSIGAVCKYHKRNTPDKRNGKYYEDYTLRTPANPEFQEWYNAFYPNGKKAIPLNMFDYFTAVSLAFMFMDDGCKTNQSYSISTNCFRTEDLRIFCSMLKDKFNIDATIWKRNVLYIKVNSRNLFEHLVKPYMCDCMLYKLHVSLNSVNLGKPISGQP